MLRLSLFNFLLCVCISSAKPKPRTFFFHSLPESPMDPQPEPVSYICGGFFPNLILLCRNWVSIFSFSANINVCLGFWGWIVIISVRILQIVAWRIRWSPATLYSAASAVTVSFTRSALVAVSFVFINSLFCIHSVSFVAAAKLSFCFLHSCILIKKIEVISNYSLPLEMIFLSVMCFL